ncbi:MAG: DNA cytosine methyltransferase [Oscillospiraceae bacterium]|nr:DNA cytosine methyltransferase [Oscillospiraceae bacterium]
MDNELTLGSLFDGSGGFPLAGMMAGIKPVWASEIEPFCIRVTTKRIPQMKHYGDISKMNGGKIEPVDIITFGSPCQNLSVAGNRSGLNGEKSSMFFEAIRVIKEMREATNGKYPRWITWENVPGSLSSKQGSDFRKVLDEICKIKDETVSVPMPEKKWESAGEIVGEDYSVAYRILNAQFFGVPQRRRRVFLVADFGGQSAGKILFESEGVFGDFTKERGSRQGTAADAETGVNKPISFEPGIIARMGGHYLSDKTNTLRSRMGDNQMCVAIKNQPMVMNEREHAATILENVANPLMATDYKGTQCVFENHSQDSRYTGPLDVAQTVSATYGMGGNNQPFVVSEDEPKTMKIRCGCEGGGKGILLQNNKSATLGCNNDQTVFVPFVKGTRPHSGTEGQEWKQDDTANTLNTFDVGETRCNELAVKTYGICSDGSNSMKSDNPHSGIYEADTARTIDGNGGNPGCNQGGMAIVKAYALQGSAIGRKDENGPNGGGVNENVSFTLNTVDRHAVYAIDRAAYNQGKNARFDISITDDDTAHTVVAKGPGAVASFYPQMKAESQCYREDGVSNTLVNGTNPGYQNGIAEPAYTVRRLTPLECCRLQGFPDYWCDELGTEDPTAADTEKWSEVFETFRKALGKSSKSKTEKQIIKWLKNPYSDSAMYAMWGNGIALPCALYVLNGIVNAWNL